jgi:hypothetical protein
VQQLIYVNSSSESCLKLLFTGEDAMFHKLCSEQTLKGMKAVCMEAIKDSKGIKKAFVVELFQETGIDMSFTW